MIGLQKFQTIDWTKPTNISGKKMFDVFTQLWTTFKGSKKLAVSLDPRLLIYLTINKCLTGDFWETDKKKELKNIIQASINKNYK